MKKVLLTLFLLLLVTTSTVSAMEFPNNNMENNNGNLNNAIQESNLIDQTIKYFKTTAINNSSMLYSLNNKPIYHTEEITKEEYENSNFNIQSTSIETTYKRLTTSISQNGAYYHYDVRLDWKNMPKVRSYDIISLSFYESVTPFNINFKQKYCESISSCVTSNSYTQHLETDGVSAIFKLPSNASLVSLSSNLSFDVRKTTSATVIKQRLVGDYAHATSNVTLNTAKNHSLGLSGISLASSISSNYDSINEAIVNWAGSW